MFFLKKMRLRDFLFHLLGILLFSKSFKIFNKNRLIPNPQVGPLHESASPSLSHESAAEQTLEALPHLTHKFFPTFDLGWFNLLGPLTDDTGKFMISLVAVSPRRSSLGELLDFFHRSVVQVSQKKMLAE